MTKLFEWADNNCRDILNESLSVPMPRGRGELVFRQLPSFLSYPTVDGMHHVVFLSYYNTPALSKKSLALRRSGRFYTTLLGCCIREDLRPLKFFNQVYEVAHYREMMALLQKANPSTISATIHPWMTGALALEAKRYAFSGKLIIDLNDAHLFISKNDCSMECVMERSLLAYTDAFTHKLPTEAIERLRTAWDIDVPDYLLHSLPCEDFFASSEVEYRPPYRLVYAGGVMPPHIAMQRGHENHIFDPIITGTVELDIDLQFYVNQNARDMFWDEQQPYFDFERKYPHFRFNKGVPFFCLPQQISSSHYGLLYDNIKISSYHPDAYKYNMSTKLFSYLEAGLPILVYSDFTYIADIVRTNGLGIVYHVNKINEIPSLLQSADYDQLRENVLSFRSTNSINSKTEDFVNAYTPLVIAHANEPFTGVNRN